jgi:hypothetical protein
MALEKQRLLAAWANADNGGIGTLNIGAVIKFATMMSPALSDPPAGKP